MNNMRNKILMTLALLLTAVTGAWAEDPNAVTAAEIKSDLYSGWSSIDEKLFKASDLPGFQAVTEDQAKSWTGVPSTGKVKLFYEFVADGNVKVVIFKDGKYDSSYEEEDLTCYLIYEDINYMGETRFFYTTGPAPEPAIDVKWNPATKTGNFVMPAYDVEIAPIYAPVAQWAKVENVDQLPTAIEGIYAESTDAIVTAGTVAKIGETENVQGTVMYAVGTSATEQPALTAFSADVPTATEIKTAGDVYVWYYIKGADTPEGQEATAENTFNDSEICAEPIKVTVLSNKFDITFNAANDNTIETGKATVTVGGTAATVTEGKLEGVKMGTEVKVTAKEGYKFRKVEAKKGGPTTIVTWNSSDFYFDANPYTKDGVTLTPSNDMAANGNNLYQFGDNTFTTTLGKFIKIEIEFESTTYTFDGWTKGTGGQYQPDTQTYPDWWENLIKLTWTGDAESVTIKGKDVFGIHSITFTIQ